MEWLARLDAQSRDKLNYLLSIIYMAAGDYFLEAPIMDQILHI
jgi:hypothetical protein